MLASKIIKVDEGWRPKPYYCSEQFSTVGYGFKIGDKFAPLPDIEMTIEEGEQRLESHIDSLHQNLSTHKDTHIAYNSAGPVRQAVLISMAYQLGVSGLLKFRKMWEALEGMNYGAAEAECLDSLAARQAPKRFQRNGWMLRTGELHKYYGGN